VFLTTLPPIYIIVAWKIGILSYGHVCRFFYISYTSRFA